MLFSEYGKHETMRGFNGGVYKLSQNLNLSFNND